MPGSPSPPPSARRAPSRDRAPCRFPDRYSRTGGAGPPPADWAWATGDRRCRQDPSATRTPRRLPPHALVRRRRPDLRRPRPRRRWRSSPKGNRSLPQSPGRNWTQTRSHRKQARSQRSSNSTLRRNRRRIPVSLRSGRWVASTRTQRRRMPALGAECQSNASNLATGRLSTSFAARHSTAHIASTLFSIAPTKPVRFRLGCHTGGGGGIVNPVGPGARARSRWPHCS